MTMRQISVVASATLTSVACAVIVLGGVMSQRVSGTDAAEEIANIEYEIAIG